MFDELCYSSQLCIVRKRGVATEDNDKLNMRVFSGSGRRGVLTSSPRGIIAFGSQIPAVNSPQCGVFSDGIPFKKMPPTLDCVTPPNLDLTLT